MALDSINLLNYSKIFVHVDLLTICQLYLRKFYNKIYIVLFSRNDFSQIESGKITS